MKRNVAIDSVFGTASARPERHLVDEWKAARADARKSNAQIEAESALRQLKTIHEMAQEMKELEGYRESNAVWSRNKGDVQRWIRSLKNAKMDIPDYVKNASSLIGGI